MAKLLLEKQPDNLLGGDNLKMASTGARRSHLLPTTVGKVFGAYQQTFDIQMMRLM